MTQYLLRIEKSFCNDNLRIHFLVFFSDRYRSNGFNKLKNGCFQFLWLWGSLDASSRTSQMTKPEKCFSSMSDTAMYVYIKKLVHSLLKSIWQKEQKATEKAAQKTAEKGPRQKKPPQQDQ
jgi:hypothetical protein